MKKAVLDDPAIEKSVDSSNMIEKIQYFSKQVEDAFSIGSASDIDKSMFSGVDKVVFTGLGGSAIGADLVSSYVKNEAAVPFLVNRNYSLPAYVDEKTLLVVCSYSGNTEETLSAMNDGLKKGARFLAISSNGKLEKQSKEHKFPCIKIPGGFPPRCALGYSFFPILVVLSKLGLVPDPTEAVHETSSLLKKLAAESYGPEIPAAKNLAKEIAGELYKHSILIYAADDYFGTVALRWRGQMAENAKALASHHVLPEMNHNEIVGWRNPSELIRKSRAVILRDKGDYSRIQLRMRITRELIERAGGKVIEVTSIGESHLARMFSLIYLGDYVSYYLALLYRVNPTPVEVIDYLKGELAKDKVF